MGRYSDDICVIVRSMGDVDCIYSSWTIVPSTNGTYRFLTTTTQVDAINVVAGGRHGALLDARTTCDGLPGVGGGACGASISGSGACGSPVVLDGTCGLAIASGREACDVLVRHL